MDPRLVFRAPFYLDINRARMQHLASLKLPIASKTVLELGAGIGDITEALMSMGCGTVTRIEARQENCDVMRQENPEHPVFCADLMRYEQLPKGLNWDVCIAYGIFYHLSDPTVAVRYMAERTREFAVVETCVSMGNYNALIRVAEKTDPTQAADGAASRPTRLWMFDLLRLSFRHVYCPTTQPDHEQFPLDWKGMPTAPLTRAIFVCSHAPMVRDDLLDYLPDAQTLDTSGR